MSGTRLALGAWVVMSFADGFRLGTYTHVTLALMTLGVIALSVPVLAAGRFPLRSPSRHELWIALAAIAVVYAPGTIVPGNRGDLFRAPMVIFLALLVALALVRLPEAFPQVGGSLVVGAAAAAGCYMIARDTPPHIDVWYLTQGAADSILHGFDMYLGHWPDSHGIQDSFPYLPGLGLALAPFRAIGLDVRHGLLLAAVASALLAWRLTPRPLGPLVAVMILVVPSWPTLVAFAWTEPLLLLLLVIAFFAVRAGRSSWAILAFGMALASKQHMLLLCPVLAAWPPFGLRRVGLATAGAALLVLPWYLTAPHAFLHGALWLNLDLPPRPDSLSLFSFATEQGWTPPFAVVGGITLLAIGVAVVLVRRTPTPSMACLQCAWVLAVFHLSNKQSFYNEWWLVLTLVVLALALADDETETLPSSVPDPMPKD